MRLYVPISMCVLCVCVCVCVCVRTRAVCVRVYCIGRQKTLEQKKKRGHFGRGGKKVRKKRDIIELCYCMLDWSTSESVSPCRRPLDWRLSRSALARIPRARTGSRTSAVLYRPAGQHTKSASTSYDVRVFASMQHRIRLD
jgi:hypothetical protein